MLSLLHVNPQREGKQKGRPSLVPFILTQGLFLRKPVLLNLEQLLLTKYDCMTKILKYAFYPWYEKDKVFCIELLFTGVIHVVNI